MKKVKCDECSGDGHNMCLARLKSGDCKWMKIPCRRCQGSGMVDNDPDRDEKRKQGILFRICRQALDFSMGELADEWGMKASEISDIEHAYQAPPENWRERFRQMGLIIPEEV